MSQRRGDEQRQGKSELQDCLKEAILLNVPVSLGNEEPRRECMAGLNVTVRWEMLTQDDKPVPEPENEDQQHHPPTKMGAVVNCKFGCKETFDRLPFMVWCTRGWLKKLLNVTF